MTIVSVKEYNRDDFSYSEAKIIIKYRKLNYNIKIHFLVIVLNYPNITDQRTFSYSCLYKE